MMRRHAGTVSTCEATISTHNWADRSPRWAGIRTEQVAVRGARVVLLRADAAPEARDQLPHLLLHGLGAAGIFQIDMVGSLTKFGAVVAPDLPGSLVGHTETPRPGAARVDINARFVPALLDTLGIDRAIVHGWSMGASVAMRAAAWYPDRVAAAILTNPPLPAPLSATDRLLVNVIGRPIAAVAPRVLRLLMRVAGRRLIAAKLALFHERKTPHALVGLGADLDRIRPDTLAVWTEQLDHVRDDPASLGHAVTAFASVLDDVVFRQAAAFDVIDSIRQPVLVVWGDQDPLLEGPTLEAVLARQPSWDTYTFAGHGHSVPVERPDDYADAVGRWLLDTHVA